MNGASIYPSCIKIPPSNSKQSTAMIPQKFDVKEALTFRSALITLANREFGEGKWNHAVTNQTIDFVEGLMGKYVCGCVTFVKIQLQDGTFHEDLGYCHVEGSLKGSAIHCARIGSLTDAFQNVLLCFGDTMKIKLQTLVRKSSNLHTRNSPKEDLECSITSLQNDIFEPYAQSTPFLTEKNDPEENKPESISCSKNPYIDTRHIPISQAIRKSESPTERKEETVSVKISNDKNGQLQPNSASHKNEQGNIPMEQEQKKALTDEEILRMERKRKQMEKQAEYKRLMKEREQQKSNETKKPNPKY